MATVSDTSTDDLLENLYQSQTIRRKQAKELALMEEREKTITAELIKRKVVSAVGWIIDRKTSEEPFGEDWTKIIAHIKATGEVDLLEKRLLKSGVKKRWEDGEAIPGVAKVEKTTLTIEKA